MIAQFFAPPHALTSPQGSGHDRRTPEEREPTEDWRRKEERWNTQTQKRRRDPPIPIKETEM